MTEAELAAVAFTEYDGTFDIDTDNKYVIYVRLTDEAGNDTMCFSAKGDNNETIWGVKYLLP